MKIAILFASWEKFGEKWGTPHAIRDELIRRGHEVTHYNLYHAEGAILPKHTIRSYSNEGINILMNDWRHGYRPDVIFCLDYGPWDAVQFDKRHFPGAILVNENGDEPQSFRAHVQKAERVHVMLSPDFPCVQLYQSNSINAIWWTHHADENIFYPRPDIKEEFDCVTTCGSRGAGLTDRIKAALGDAFNNDRYFYGDDHAKRLCMGKMVFQCSQYKEVTRRIFEGMACGKMVITDRLPLETKLHELFVDGEDVVYYTDSDDAIEKIRYYASHDEERQRIAKNGFEKVMANHTVAKRVDVLEQVVNEIQSQK